jgi:hypothetical protein
MPVGASTIHHLQVQVKLKVLLEKVAVMAINKKLTPRNLGDNVK